MFRILIYLFPAMMDMAMGAAFFLAPVQAKEWMASVLVVACLPTAGGAAYMLASLAVGRIVTRGNAVKLLITGCLIIAAIAVGFTTCTQIWGLYLLLMLQSASAALFFTPYQVLIRQMHHSAGGSPVKAASIYTASWSMGFAAGPLVAGWLWGIPSVGWAGCHLLNAGICITLACSVYLLKRHMAHTPHPDAPKRDDDPRDQVDPIAIYADMPDMAWMGWVFAGIGCAVFGWLRGVFPSSGGVLALPKFDQGLVLCLMSLAQAIAALAMYRSRWWMYRPAPLAVFGLFGVVGAGLFASADSTLTFCLGAACFGVYSGSAFMYLVFHALVHPTRAGQYVAKNEFTAGLAGIIGPFAGGAVANVFGLNVSYVVAAMVLMAAIAVQCRLHARSCPRTRR